LVILGSKYIFPLYIYINLKMKAKNNNNNYELPPNPMAGQDMILATPNDQSGRWLKQPPRPFGGHPHLARGCFRPPLMASLGVVDIAIEGGLAKK
jgi:hypothetical protein